MNKDFLLSVVRECDEREPADIVSAMDTLKLNFNLVPVKIFFLNDGEKVAFIIDLFNIPASTDSFIKEVREYINNNENLVNKYEEFEIEDFNEFSYPTHIPTRQQYAIKESQP